MSRLLVPLVDVVWFDVSAPEAAGRAPGAEAIARCADEMAATDRLMSDLGAGSYAISPYAGYLCEDGLYSGPILQVYREAVVKGAEMVVHVHADQAAGPVRYGDHGYMRQILRDRRRDLAAAGMGSVCYRSGEFGFASDLPGLLREEGFAIDLSGVAGHRDDHVGAAWPPEPRDAHYLDGGDLLEIPLGSDGTGTDRTRNYLHLEASDLDNQLRILAANETGDATGRPVVIQALFHSCSMSRPALVERWQRLLEAARNSGWVIASPSQAKAQFDRAGARSPEALPSPA